MKIIVFHIILLTLVGCSVESPICSDLENVYYLVNYYYGNMDKINYTEYYNEKDQILRRWDPGEKIINYTYDTKGSLIEIQYSRNCQSVYKYKYNIFNNEGQLINEHTSRKPILNIDSIQNEQSKFYNDTGQLEKEISSTNGKNYYTSYFYNNNILNRKVIVDQSGEVTESVSYFHDKTGLIDSVEIYKNGINKVEINTYDSRNRITSKIVKSKTKLIFDRPFIDSNQVIFDNQNHKRTFEYKSNGKIKIERRLNVNGKSNLTIITEKKYVT